jgi:ABC-type phosphate transport system substrate-binding protein
MAGRRGPARFFLLAALWGALLWGAAGYGADEVVEPMFVVVVNSSNPIDELPRSQLAKIFLHQVRRWDFEDPTKENPLVEVVEQPEGSDLRENFSLLVHRRSSRHLKTYWQKRIFSGRGRQPTTRAADSEILAFIREHVGGVGYVAVGTSLPSGTKELRVGYQN